MLVETGELGQKVLQTSNDIVDILHKTACLNDAPDCRLTKKTCYISSDGVPVWDLFLLENILTTPRPAAKTQG